MLSQTIPSYLYQEYSDDVDLQAFVSAYNQMTQQYVTWFNTIGLPIYTGLSGPLLDWVCNGLYGYYRPTLQGQLVSDDIFQRCLTWQFYKGDGTTFSIEWLKRRVVRFLTGANGTDPGVQQEWQVSVTFGPPNLVFINILQGIAVLNDGAMYNTSQLDQLQYNELDTTVQHFMDTSLSLILQEALESNVLSFPFQFKAIVGINP